MQGKRKRLTEIEIEIYRMKKTKQKQRQLANIILFLMEFQQLVLIYFAHCKLQLIILI